MIFKIEYEIPLTRAIYSKSVRAESWPAAQLAFLTEHPKAVARKVEVIENEDTERLEKLAIYLSDPNNNISGPFKSDTSWQFGHNAGEAYQIDGAGETLRDAIDSLVLTEGGREGA